MPFKRVWDNQCPSVWDEWTDGDKKWVIQDLDPADDEKAVNLFLTHFINREFLSDTIFHITSKPEAVEDCRVFWQYVVAARATLACYCEHNGIREIAGMNGCVVSCIDDKKDFIDLFKSHEWRQVVAMMDQVADMSNIYKLYSVDKYLSGAGLLVMPDYTGAGLGARILRAREPLCRHLGIKATGTFFSGPASQASGKNAGFDTITTLTLTELAKLGYDVPSDDKVIKYMAKKYE